MPLGIRPSASDRSHGIADARSYVTAGVTSLAIDEHTIESDACASDNREQPLDAARQDIVGPNRRGDASRRRLQISNGASGFNTENEVAPLPLDARVAAANQTTVVEAE
jgi:hypothetical protein